MESSGIKRRKARYRLPKRVSDPVDVALQPLPLTPAGVIKGYGNLFRGVRARSRGKRIAAMAFVFVSFVPLLIIGIGLAVTIVRSI